MRVILLFIAFYWLWDRWRENEDYLSRTEETCQRTRRGCHRRERQRGTLPGAISHEEKAGKDEGTEAAAARPSARGGPAQRAGPAPAGTHRHSEPK